MEKQSRSYRSLGIPPGLSAELRMSLAAELRRMGATYPEIARAADPPLTPAQVLAMARAWNGLTPSQQAGWHDAALAENLRGADPSSRN